MDEQLAELQSLAAIARAKKGRMDSVSRVRAAELLSLLWCEFPELARETPLLFDDLSSEAVADGVLRMWVRLPNERRADFKRAIYKPTTERAVRRLALLVAAVINTDGYTAFEWLQVLLPRERQNIAKDVQQSLSSALFTSPPLAFENLASDHFDGGEVCRIYSALWDIAKSAPQGSSLMARARLAKAFGRFALRQTGENIQIRMFLSDLQLEKNTWPAHLKDLFDKELPELQGGTALSGEPPANEKANSVASYGAPTSQVSNVSQFSEAVEARPKSTTDEQESDEIRNTSDQTAATVSTPETQSSILIDRLMNNARIDLSTLNALNDIVKALAGKNDTLTSEIEAAKRRAVIVEIDSRDTVMKLEKQCMHTNAVVAELKAEVERAAERERSVTTRLTIERDDANYEVLRIRDDIGQMKGTWDEERRVLAQQISANAAGRVDEFRKRLGSSLSRLVLDLPQKDTPMSSELGSAVLLLFHQLVEALQEQGVPLTAGKKIQ